MLSRFHVELAKIIWSYFLIWSQRGCLGLPLCMGMLLYSIYTWFNKLNILLYYFRFPDTDILSAFGVLAMRPLPSLPSAQVEKWGEGEIAKLTSHFGVEKSAQWKDNDGILKNKTVPPLIDQEEAEREWPKLKETVIAQSYPIFDFICLWKLIIRFHKEEFPNLIKLAQLVIVLPVHTADVERGFSTQNNILSNRRNRLNPETQDILMKQKMEGERLEWDSEENREKSNLYLTKVIKKFEGKKYKKII